MPSGLPSAVVSGVLTTEPPAVETFAAFVGSDSLKWLVGPERAQDYQLKFAALTLAAGIAYEPLSEESCAKQLPKTASWNWAAFFLGPLWAAYRRLHSGGQLLWNPFVLTLLIVSISVLPKAFGDDRPSILGYSQTDLILTLMVPLTYGIYANGALLYTLRRRYLLQRHGQSPTSVLAAVAMLVWIALLLSAEPVAVDLLRDGGNDLRLFYQWD